MATRTTVETKIAALEDNGNNTAKEVRDVLNEMLDYTENVPFPPFPEIPDVKFFHYWTDKNPVIDKLQNFLYYSVKGIKNQWVNLTFYLQINTTKTKNEAGLSDNVYSFPLQDTDKELVGYLKDIIQLNIPLPRFFIPYTIIVNKQETDYPLSTSIYFTEDSIVFDFNNTINSDGEIGIMKGKAASSVSFHWPMFAILKGKP